MVPTKESNTIKRTLDLTKPPHLSAAQRKRLDAVAAMQDSQIDYMMGVPFFLEIGTMIGSPN